MSDTDPVVDDIIDHILNNRNYFSRLSLEDKISVKNSQPRPRLDLQQIEKNSKSTRRFQMQWYATYPWLTGSSKRQKMFCFPCLLFEQNNKNEWNHQGLGAESLKNFILKTQRHVAVLTHITATIKLKELGSNRIDYALSSAVRAAAIKNNERVKKNRAIVERIVQSICYLTKQELALRGHDERPNSENTGNYLELLNLLAINDAVMKEHLESGTVFKGTSSDIQNQIIECITAIIQEDIREKVTESDFLSIQADETTDVSTISQLSIIVRYIDPTTFEIEEKFMGFYDVSADKTANGVYTKLLEFLQKWNIPSAKLVSQTYDGASVMAGARNGVHMLLKRDYPHALFIHCYAHQLNLVLLHGSKNIKDVKLFVANITLFHTFFSRSSKRSQLLREKGFKLPHPCETRWNYNSRGVSTIKSHFFDLYAALKYVIEDKNDEWDPSSIALAQSVLKVLINPKFIFLIHFYDGIFSKTDILFDILQKINTNVAQCIEEIKNCKRIFSLLRDEQYIISCTAQSEGFLNRMKEIDEADGDGGNESESQSDGANDDDDAIENKSRTVVYNEKFVGQLRRIAFEILDSITVQLEERFGDFEELQFFKLVTVSNFAQYAQHFPDIELKKLLKQYPFFNETLLKNQLDYVYKNKDKHLEPHTLLKSLVSNGIDDCLPQVVKLLKLLLTIPATTASCERSMSALKRVKTYLRSTMSNFRLSNLGTLAIEKKHLKENMCNLEFINRVIDKFADDKDRRIDLKYTVVPK